jgi:WhiB family redox-sensing transcriptional regulator
MSSGSVIILARQAVELTRPVPCRDGDPRLWFAEDPEDLELAKAHCRACPLRAACLAGAIERREPCGVWGGEIFERGRILAVKRRRGRPNTDRADRGAGATGPARKAASARKAGPVRTGGPAWTDMPTGKDQAPLREMCG